jgi:DNA-binding PadR family transcriptional regulator
VYAVTPEGEVAFERWLHEPVARGRQFRMDFMAKLYFAHREETAIVRTLLQRQRAACREWLEHLSPAVSDGQHEPFPQLVRSYRAGQIRAMLAWLAECEHVLLSRS